MKYRDDNFYATHNCTLLYGKATKIDEKAKQVILTNGEKISFDKLLVATGSSAFVPPFEGLETVEHQCTFMCLDDSRELDKMLDDTAIPS